MRADARNFAASAVDAAGTFADTFDTFDDRLAVNILEFDDDLTFDAFAFDRNFTDITFVLEHVGNRFLFTGKRNADGFKFGSTGIADAGKHIGDGVLHTHFFCFPSLNYQLALVTPGI